MAKEKGKDPVALPDESLDDAAGGLLPAVQKATISGGTSNRTGFLGGVRVASGDVNSDGTALKIADGSVKPAADGSV